VRGVLRFGRFGVGGAAMNGQEGEKRIAVHFGAHAKN
jgi:hypothetical protein